jgi:hypothetical protein
MGLSRTFGVFSGVHGVAAGSVSMMGGLFMLPTLMVLGCFIMMSGRMSVML